MTRAEHLEMKNLCRIAKYFNMSWQDIELIPCNSGVRFKIDKDCVFEASTDDRGRLLIKTIKQDNVSNYNHMQTFICKSTEGSNL